MATLQKAIDMFNAIPIKIPVTFLTNRNVHPKVHMEEQNTSNNQSNLSKKRHTGHITIAAFMLYYRAIVMKTAWDWHKNRHKDQWNRIEVPDINQGN
jgi:hypothetical protein